MSWLAILLALAALGGDPAPGARPTLKQCKQITNAAAKKQCRKAAKAKPKKPSKGRSRTRPKAPQRPAAGRPETPSTSPTHRSQPESAPRSGDDPRATPAPAPGASPTPAPTVTPAPGSLYPSRTGVELTDTDVWSIRVSYRVLAAGRIDFVTTNVGEDDHDLSVRQGSRLLGRLPLAHGEFDTLALDLPTGAYTLYCSLTGHEDAGMRANVTVR